MLGNFEGWLLSVVAILCVWMYLFVRKGPAAALGAAMVLSFAFPVWLKFEVGGVPFDIRTVTAIVGLSILLVRPGIFHPRNKALVPLTFLDLSIAMIVLTHITSDSFATSLTPSLPFRAYGEWALPYVAGRYAVRSRDDLNWIARWVAVVVVLFGILSCIESVTKVNLCEMVFGNRPADLANRDATRFGLKRAFGPTTHPIFFGMLIAILMPWLVCVRQSYKSRRDYMFYGLAGAIGFAGTVFTMSRTAVLTVAGTFALTLALRYKGLRWPLGFLLAITVGVFLAFPNEVTDTISRLSGGGDKQRVIEIDGKAVITSSTRTRLHVFGIYSDALLKAGPFGYGTAVTSKFPLSIPSMQGTFKSSMLFEQVDNAYILLTLRFGWIGGFCLVLLFATAIWTGFSLNSERSLPLFPGVVACMLAVSACFSFLLVFMNYDFGLQLLWTIGVLSGLASSRSEGGLRSTSGSFNNSFV